MKTKVNEDDNELPGRRLCVGLLGCHYGAGHICYRACGSRRAVASAGMLRGSYLWTFDGYDNLDGNFVPIAVMQGLRFNGDGTTLNTFGTVNIGGTIIFDAGGFSGTYTVNADCTGTLSPAPGIAPTFNIYVGPGAQQVWTIQSAPRWKWHPRSEQGNGGTRAVVKAPTTSSV